MNTIQVVLLGWCFCSVVMLILYAIQRRTSDASMVDVAWAANLGILAVWYGMMLEGHSLRQWLLMAFAGFWSVRLSVYLLFDRVIGKEEDGRYRKIRGSWKGDIQVFFFWFFQAQALLDVLLSVSFLIVALNPKPHLDGWDALAAIIFVVSVGGESIADRQLSRFRSNPSNQGKTCRSGLWKCSRHPNYFFEWLHWWVYPLLAVGSPQWWATLIAPALMLFFLFKITGIPATEEQALKSRGDDYRDYQRTTSVFIPWFPQKIKTQT